MESLKEVLIRVDGFSEEDAEEKINTAKELLTEGVSPEEVLVKEYGTDLQHLTAILDPSI